MEYSRVIQPIALESPWVVLPDGYPVCVAGWGTLQPHGRLPNTLRYVDINVSRDRACRRAYPWVRPGSGMFCAGVAAGGKDSCQGDSGGPLWREDEETHQLVQVLEQYFFSFFSFLCTGILFFFRWAS